MHHILGRWGVLLQRVAIGMSEALTSRDSRRQMFGTALAGLILGLGSVSVGSSIVQASERDGIAGFFEMLFGGGQRQQQADVRPPPQPTRYNSLPTRRLDRTPRRVAHTPRPESFSYGFEERRHRRRKATMEVAAVAPGRGDRTVCVRRCDGYLFPLGSLRDPADLPLHQSACAAACPNAATEVFTIAAGETELDRAVSAAGVPYRASAVANVYRQRRVANCSCQPAGGAVHVSLDTDPTLRQGDIIATGTSAQVVTRIRTGRVDLQDYRRAAIGRSQVRAIEARVGTIRREAAARSFRQQIRSVEQSAIVQVAGAGEAFLPVRATLRDTPRVVTPSPYLR